MSIADLRTGIKTVIDTLDVLHVYDNTELVAALPAAVVRWPLRINTVPTYDQGWDYTFLVRLHMAQAGRAADDYMERLLAEDGDESIVETLRVAGYNVTVVDDFGLEEVAGSEVLSCTLTVEVMS